jgi:hypothetical protein
MGGLVSLCCDEDNATRPLVSRHKVVNPVFYLTLEQYLLQQGNKGEKFLKMFQDSKNKGIEEIDILLNILNFGCDVLDQDLRRNLLVIMQRIVSNSQGISFFNSTGFVDNLPRTRFDRIKILLQEVNEELEEGECVLDTLRYKSLMFEKINAGWKMKYTLVLDKSSSMAQKDHNCSRWEDASKPQL